MYAVIKTGGKQYRVAPDDVLTIEKVKGDAGVLHLDSFESRAHEFEDMLTTLREQQVISGNNFLPLTIKLNEIRTIEYSISFTFNVNWLLNSAGK